MVAIGRQKYLAILSAAGLAVPLFCHLAYASPKAINITPEKTTRSTAKPKPVDSEARAGVQLLESILLRLHNMPQLALNQSQQALQPAGGLIAMQQGPNQSDPNLLIRPKDLSRVAQKLRAMSESIAQQMPSSNVRIASASTNSLARQAEPAVNEQTIGAPRRGTIWERGETNLVADERAASSGSITDEDALGNGPVIRDYAKMPMPGLNDKERARSAQLLTDGIAKANSPAFANLAGTLAGKSLNLDESQLNKVANKKAALAKTGGMAGNLKKTDAKRKDSAYRAGASSDDKLLPPPPPQTLQKQGQNINPRPITNDLMSYLPALAKFTAVPPVRLGDTENEISHPLMDMGTIRREVVKNWTVFSVHKNNSKNVSMQVFLKAGNVDAILVMDPSIWTGQQGVTIGDALPAIKQKFGEPAFIVSAEHNSTVQNYIYPISQVGFQLQSDTDADMPKVKSILIFNVK